MRACTLEGIEGDKEKKRVCALERVKEKKHARHAGALAATCLREEPKRVAPAPRECVR